MSDDDSFGLVASRRAFELQRDGPVPIAALYYNVESPEGGMRFKPYDGAEAAADAAALASLIGATSTTPGVKRS